MRVGRGGGDAGAMPDALRTSGPALTRCTACAPRRSRRSLSCLRPGARSTARIASWRIAAAISGWCGSPGHRPSGSRCTRPGSQATPQGHAVRAPAVSRVGRVPPQLDLDLRRLPLSRLPQARRVRGHGPRDPQMDQRAGLDRGDLDPGAGRVPRRTRERGAARADRGPPGPSARRHLPLRCRR